ncbi:MAG: hypothetical protein WD795_19960, partial [Woeseia sp.]
KRHKRKDENCPCKGVKSTPMTLQYPQTPSFKQGDCMVLQPAMVRWASGAEASIQQLQACGTTGYVQQFVFIRPKEIPGRELNIQFSLELQQLAVQQALAQAQRDAAAIQLFNTLNQQNEQATKNQTFRCTSEAIRGTIYTDCR